MIRRKKLYGRIFLWIEKCGSFSEGFLFGSTEIKVYYKKDSMIFEKKLFSTSLENDGGHPTEDSVRYSWKDNVCSISLISSEGKSKYYQIIFDDEVTYR